MWSEIGQVEPGTALLTRDGDRAVLEGVTWREGEFEVFNFTVDNRHNYFVAGSERVPGALVHNCPDRVDDVLHHYTDAAGARAIEKSKVIKADANGNVFLTTDKISPEDANNALFMGQGGSKGTHRVDIRLKDDTKLTTQGATQPNEIIHKGSVRAPRNAEITVQENDF